MSIELELERVIVERDIQAIIWTEASKYASSLWAWWVYPALAWILIDLVSARQVRRGMGIGAATKAEIRELPEYMRYSRPPVFLLQNTLFYTLITCLLAWGIFTGTYVASALLLVCVPHLSWLPLAQWTLEAHDNGILFYVTLWSLGSYALPKDAKWWVGISMCMTSGAFAWLVDSQTAALGVMVVLLILHALIDNVPEQLLQQRQWTTRNARLHSQIVELTNKGEFFSGVALDKDRKRFNSWRLRLDNHTPAENETSSVMIADMVWRVLVTLMNLYDQCGGFTIGSLSPDTLLFWGGLRITLPASWRQWNMFDRRKDLESLLGIIDFTANHAVWKGKRPAPEVQTLMDELRTLIRDTESFDDDDDDDDEAKAKSVKLTNGSKSIMVRALEISKQGMHSAESKEQEKKKEKDDDDDHDAAGGDGDEGDEKDDE